MSESTDTAETSADADTSTDTDVETTDSQDASTVDTPSDQEIDWKAKAREWEKRAKTHQTEARRNADAARRLAAIENEKKSAEERAQERERKAEARERTASERVAKADLRAALTGIVDDPDSIIEDLSIGRFLTDDGEPDEDAIASLKARYEALRPPTTRAPKPNPAQGANGSKEHEKPLTEADLARMTPKEINEARKAGRLDHLMGRRPSLNK